MSSDKPANTDNTHDHPPPNAVERWVHSAIGEVYGAFGLPNQNSARDEGRPLSVKVLDMIQIAPYAQYYAAYNLAKGINWVGSQLGPVGEAASHIIAAPLVPFEIGGLAGNEIISMGIMAADKGRGNMYEGFEGGIVPHFAMDKPPRVYLPGIHEDGHIDFEW